MTMESEKISNLEKEVGPNSQQKSVQCYWQYFFVSNRHINKQIYNAVSKHTVLYISDSGIMKK